MNTEADKTINRWRKFKNIMLQRKGKKEHIKAQVSSVGKQSKPLTDMNYYQSK